MRGAQGVGRIWPLWSMLSDYKEHSSPCEPGGRLTAGVMPQGKSPGPLQLGGLPSWF